jgi:hypothetical protein
VYLQGNNSAMGEQSTQKISGTHRQAKAMTRKNKKQDAYNSL